MNILEKSKQHVLNLYPNLKKPFELDADGLFFLDMLVNNISKNLYNFVYKYDDIRESEDISIFNLTSLCEAYKSLLSLHYFIGMEPSTIIDNLDKICKHIGVSDNDFYMCGELHDRLKYISLYFLRKSYNFPLSDKYLIRGDNKLLIGNETSTLVNYTIFDIIYFLYKSIDTSNSIEDYNAKYISAIISFYKLIIIMGIHEDIRIR